MPAIRDNQNIPEIDDPYDPCKPGTRPNHQRHDSAQQKACPASKWTLLL
jgi:hypothetical protein